MAETNLGVWKGVCISRTMPTDVDALYDHFFRELFNSASRVILIEGLPEKADLNFVMTKLLLNGSIAIVKINGDIYMTNGYLGGERDVNYFGTRVIGSNPSLGSYNLKRGEEAEMAFLTPFDNLPLIVGGGSRDRGGLYSLISFTASLLADNLCSLNTSQINGRVQAIITAEDSTIAATAEGVLKELYAGKPYKVITEDLYKRIHVNPLASSIQAHQLIELIETQQYIRAMFWNAIGIDCNYNMKRERLITAEVESNYVSLKVPISTILNNLNSCFEAANNALGTSLHAKLNPEYKEEVVNSQPDKKEADDNAKNKNSSTDDGKSLE